MPPFHRSTLNYLVAQQVVADSAGASGDAEMLTRAGRALDATAQKWNRIRWRFLLTEAPNQSLIAPFTVTGCSTTVNSGAVTSTSNFSTVGVLVDDLILGGGLDNESTVATTGTTAITVNASALATVTGATLTFYRTLHPLPTDFKSVYDVRLISNPRPLFYVQRRNYDRAITQQSNPGVQTAYDLFLSDSGGQIRIVPPNSGPDVLKLRYFRRISMPTLTATASGLDIPQDTEDVFLAAAKSYFLIDKEGPSSERAQYWSGYAEKGLKEILNDTNVIPDEELRWQPPLGTGGFWNPNSTLGYDDGG